MTTTAQQDSSSIEQQDKVYTVFNMYQADMLQGIELRDGTCEDFEFLHTPHCPRESIENKRAIATGIFEDAPEAIFLDQTEAEELMQTPEWTTYLD